VCICLTQDLLKALRDIHAGAVTDSDVTQLRQLLLIDDDDTVKVDIELFSISAALMERMIYPRAV